MRKPALVCLTLIAVTTVVFAEMHQGCVHGKDAVLSVRACTEAIRRDPNAAWAYVGRGNAYWSKRDYDRAIADYNRAIEINPSDPVAYNQRGNAYDDKGDRNRAVADYNRAIGLNPNDPNTYYNRGLSYTRRGDYDRAIADYSRAIELDATYAKAYIRGYVRFYKADFANAAADFLRLIELQPDDAYVPYVMLLRFLARVRAGEDATVELEAHATRLKTIEWPYPVIELYLGRRSPDATTVVATNAEQRCEADFYVGQWHLLRRNRPEAIRLLQAAADACPKNFVEYSGAIAELSRTKP